MYKSSHVNQTAVQVQTIQTKIDFIKCLLYIYYQAESHFFRLLVVMATSLSKLITDINGCDSYFLHNITVLVDSTHVFLGTQIMDLYLHANMIHVAHADSGYG